MSRPVNELQLKVLRWIADGRPSDNPPTEGSLYKTSAYSLQTRRLITIDRRRGVWRAEVTEAGRYFLEHGSYPTVTPTAKASDTQHRLSPKASPPAIVSSVPRLDDSVAGDAEGNADAQPERFSGAPELPIATQIRKPHPAIRELIDHPKRVDLPPALRRRVHLMSHTLVEEALRRGWTVVPVKSEFREAVWPPSRQERFWPSEDLFRIDAGKQPVGIRFRVKTRRRDHVDTPEEARRRAKGQYVYAPRYDYEPTDILRLFLYDGGYQAKSWEDSARTPLEDRLPKALDRIEAATEREIAREAEERRRQEEARRRYSEEQRQKERLAHYDRWRDALLELERRWREHQELTSFVDALAATATSGDDDAASAQVVAFLAWAHEYLKASDPMVGPEVPTGEPPEMSYDEWTRWRTYFDARGRGIGWPGRFR